MNYIHREINITQLDKSLSILYEKCKNYLKEKEEYITNYEFSLERFLYNKKVIIFIENNKEELELFDIYELIKIRKEYINIINNLLPIINFDILDYILAPYIKI